MSLARNKKITAKKDDNSLEIVHQTIYSSLFEIQAEGEKIEKISKISFTNCIMIDIPKAESLHKAAPKLDQLAILSSKLTRISSWDFRGYGGLTQLCMDENEIEELPGNLFIHTPNLQDISFASNKIKVIGENILDPLTNLRNFDLSDNPGIDTSYFTHSYEDAKNGFDLRLEQFKEEIKRCKPIRQVWDIVNDQKNAIEALMKENEALKKEFEEVKQAVAFTKLNFTLKVNGKEFKVQKEILAANSPLLAQMIRDNADIDILELKDISEEIFEEILNYMNTKQPPKPTANFIELYAKSGRLQMKELMDLCAQKLMDIVTPENSLEVLLICERFRNIDLQKKAIDEYKKKI